LSGGPFDVAVVGGGPAGLAAACAAALAGLRVVVLERRALPADKACGEGLLPKAVEALAALGALDHLDRAGCAPFSRLRWIQEDGSSAEARLPAPGGLGVRRLALSAALGRRAVELGVEVRDRSEVVAHRREPDRVVLQTDAGEVVARMLVAADGLSSPIRRREGLDLPSTGPRRFGLRRHHAVAPWADAVEVHFARGVEAYLTPAGPGRVGLAFLFEEGEPADADALLARFPILAARLGGAPAETRPLGAGPLARRTRARVADRLALVGDAGGYLDAITGEGLSLAFEGALALGRILPEALERGAGRDALRPYEREVEGSYRRYAAVTRLVLAMARRPRLRRSVLRRLGRHPRLFERLVAAAVGPGGKGTPSPPARPGG
jgi:flavin-dependent dehydrogenase